MVDSVVKNITDLLGGSVAAEWIIFIISMIPILELRGGIIAAKFLGVNWKLALGICMLGNMVPIPFILLFIKKILEWMKKTRLHRISDFFEKKANDKAESILKYKKLGLFIFVAIPLPGTGAWTGALVASLLGIKLKDAVISILAGVVTAGIIMSIFSYGFLGLFF